MKRSGDGKERWKLLQSLLLKNKTPTDSSEAARHVSVRRFSSYNLAQTKPLVEEYGDQWYEYEFEEHNANLKVKHYESQSKKDLLLFNNTGNVCVWPSEEVLAFYCLENINNFQGLKICELGGGMTCLAGLIIAKYSNADYVLLTDGNELSVTNVCESLLKNNFETEVHAQVLRWDYTYEDLKENFDLIICADCLFFDEFRSSLVQTLDRLLTPQGEVLILAPSRGQTLNDFVKLAGEYFTVQVRLYYNKRVYELYKDKLCDEFYDPNLHYPLQIKLYRKCGGR